MFNNTMDYPLFLEYLENENLAARTKRFYGRVICQFLKTNPDVYDYNSYMQFLIDTCIKKRNPANLYALIKYVQFKISDATLKSSIINKMKSLNITQKPAVQYIDKKPLSNKEISTLLSKFTKHKHYVMSLIMFECGARVSDILNIKNDAIQVESEQDEQVMKLRYIAKGGKLAVKWIYNKEVIKVVQDYIAKHIPMTDYIFVDKVYKQNRMSTDIEISRTQDSNRNCYYKDLKQALIDSCIDRTRFACHSFRRNFGHRVWEWSHNIDSVKKMLGHKRVETTLLYLQQFGYDTADISKDFYNRNKLV